MGGGGSGAAVDLLLLNTFRREAKECFRPGVGKDVGVVVDVAERLARVVDVANEGVLGKAWFP